MRVKHHLKHWFVPHRHNDHRPRLIRWYGLATVVAVMIAVQGLAIVTTPAAAKVRQPHTGSVLAYATDINPADLLTQTNQQRAANGLPALRLDARLNQSAALKANDMFTYNYWAHVNPATGAQPWQWFTEAGYHYSYAGENLAKDFDTTSGVMSGWMNSPGHRANILNVNYTDVGFAVENGTLVGGQTTLVVAHYGREAGTTAPAAPSAPKSTVRASVATPVATPVPTPTATPVPTPTASPTPTPSPVVASGNISPGAPPPQNYSLLRPLAVTKTLPWPRLAILLVLALLLGVYTATHLAAWRRGLRRWQHRGYRRLAYVQVAGLTAVILMIASSGFGRVG